MDSLCGHRTFGNLSSGRHLESVTWALRHFECFVDLLNFAISATFAYLILLILIYLRCSRLQSQLAFNAYLFCGHYFRAFLTLLLFLAHVSEFGDSLLASKITVHDVLVPITSLIAWSIVISLHIQIERACRPKYLSLSIILWICTGIGRGLRFNCLISNGTVDWSMMRIYTTLTVIILCGILILIDCITLYVEICKKHYIIHNRSQQYTGYQHSDVSVYSKATFWWLTQLLWAGYREPLEINVLGDLPVKENSFTQFEKFNNIYSKQKYKSKKQSNVSLWKCYIAFCWKNFMLGGLLKLFGDCMMLVGPLGIPVIINYVSKSDDVEMLNKYITVYEFFHNGYIVAFIVFIAAIAQGTLSQGSTHLINVEGIRLKVALQGIIYNKSLKLSSWTIKEQKDEIDSNHNEQSNKKIDKDDSKNKRNSQNTNSDQNGRTLDIGTVTNLMADDVFNIMSFVWIGHYIWAIPLKITVLIYLLHEQLGISAVIGAIFCILTMAPLQLFIGKQMSKNSELISEQSDERLRKINESVHAIKLLKLLAWEHLHEARIQATRRNEIKYLDKDSLYWALMTFITHASSVLITLVTFGVYFLMEDAALQPSSVFASLALFNQLTVPLFIFPVIVPIMINAIVSTRRLKEYLSQSEIEPVIPTLRTYSSDKFNGSKQSEMVTLNSIQQNTEKVSFGLNHIVEDEEKEHDEIKYPYMEGIPDAISENPCTNMKEVAVSIENGYFAWSSSINSIEKASMVLDKIVIPKGKLTIIVGKVGSGKTSVISAMLGEMHTIRGKLYWNNNISLAYVTQKPWLLNATLRDNILFGEPFRTRRYRRVIQACALQPDLDLLPNNDLTEIGEKGINLSGGQKQRISIARALYSTASIVVLDDPLSALDYQVAQEVFENGIRKMMIKQKRTVILITHRLQLIHTADQIIAVEKGTIRAQGTLQQIEKTDPSLTREWRTAMSCDKTDGDNRVTKTAKERWSLFKLVSRIGIQLKQKNSINTSWNTDEETHVTPPIYRPLRKRPSSTYGSRYLAHDLPLPTDEREDEMGEERMTKRRSRCLPNTRWSGSDNLYSTSAIWDSNTRLHKAATRAISLQTRRKKDVPTPVVRQLSSPSMQHDLLCPTLSARSRTNTMDNVDVQSTSKIKFGSQKSMSEVIHSGTNHVKEKSLLKRLLSSTSLRGSTNTLIKEKVPIKRLKSTESAESENLEDAEELMPVDTNGLTADRSSMNEERMYGHIPKQVFYAYARAGGRCIAFGYLITALAWQVCRVCTDYWLRRWTECENNITASNSSDGVPTYLHTREDRMQYYLFGYTILSAVSLIMSFASNGLGQYCGAVARRQLHDEMLNNLFRCKMSFFESTPIGRIINRFSTDMSIIDKKIATSIQRLLQFLFLCISAILVNAIITPWFLVIAIPICLIYYIVQKFYRSSSRELQRLDILTRSPLLSHFSETLDGLVTIRAYGHQERFTKALHNKLDTHTNAYLILNTSNRWLGVCLDYLGGVIVFTATLASLISSHFYPELVTPALVGFAVNYILLVPVYLTWVVKFLDDMEMYMSAVERVKHYSTMDTEDYREYVYKAVQSWPKTGDIVFEKVSLRYNEQHEPIMKNFSLHIPAGQKVGVCGRTGSGKSSITLSLFGMIDVCEGNILIDGININKIPLRQLRSRLSIIPQDVIMFGGTVRDNLDPERLYTDEQLWQSLELAQIKDIVSDQLGGLDGEVQEGGSNLSPGERQLLYMARATLNTSSILIMDEATSSVDLSTEYALLLAAKQAFKNSTVITIAHRLETILDCDRIIVLEEGKIVGDGSPNELKENPNGIFAKMLNSSRDKI